jgi:FkbM family methyltransferase
MNDMATYKSQLDLLLSEDIESARKRERSVYDEMTTPLGHMIVLCGAGGLGRKTLAGLRMLGKEPVALTDNNISLWGTNIEGLTVLSPKEAADKFGRKAIFIITIWNGQLPDTMAQCCKQYIDLHCTNVVPFAFLYWKYPDVFLPHYAFDLAHKVIEQAPDVKKALSLFLDEPSQREYLSQIRWRLLLDFDCLPSPVTHEIYFPDDLISILPDEVFIDCGAFDGDTLSSFLKRSRDAFTQYIAFEPDPINLNKLNAYINTLSVSTRSKIKVYNYAVGSQKEKLLFNATGTGASSLGIGTLEVNCEKMDDLIKDLKTTFLKMDIEGAEPDALYGAKHIIQKYKPALAICVYHKQDHLWSIPLFINSLSEDYYFFLRPHLYKVWDLVCYAIPKTRFKK